MTDMKMLSYFGPHIITGTLYRRTTGSTNSEGDWIPGSGTDSSIELVTPQPVKADEIVMGSDGASISDYKQTFVDSDVDVRTRTNNADSDQIIAEGVRYKVHQIDNWATEGGFKHIYLRRV